MLFSGSLAISLPYLYGFANFALSIALAFHAMALWIALERRPVLRTLVFVPIGFALWLCHLVGWAVFSLVAGMTALAAGWRAGARRLRPTAACFRLLRQRPGEHRPRPGAGAGHPPAPARRVLPRRRRLARKRQVAHSLRLVELVLVGVEGAHLLPDVDQVVTHLDAVLVDRLDVELGDAAAHFGDRSTPLVDAFAATVPSRAA